MVYLGRKRSSTVPKQKNKKPVKRSKNPFIAALVSVFLAAAIFADLWAHHNTPVQQVSTPQSTSTSTTPTNTTNLNPPTAEDKQAVDEHKETISNPPASTSTKTVTPIIVDANEYDGQVEIRSFVPGIFENGGTCTATLKMGSLTVTKSASANADATTTNCTKFVIPASEFSSKGTWSATISYNSANYQGTSAPSNVEIQ